MRHFTFRGSVGLAGHGQQVRLAHLARVAQMRGALEEGRALRRSTRSEAPMEHTPAQPVRP